jgi:LPXTG-motif cell wall-anchored protein
VEPYLILAVLAALIMGGGGWWLSRRRKELLGDEDEWPGRAESGAEEDLPPQLYDRSALIDRPRVLNVRGWDDSPDGESTGEPVEEDLPTHFDRDYLRSRENRDQTPD